MREITDKEFFELSKTDSVKVFDFWAPWCGPCKMLAPVLEEVASEFSNIEFYKVNVDENQEAAGEFGIMSIPTLLIMKNGEVLEEKTGYQPLSDYILSRIPRSDAEVLLLDRNRRGATLCPSRRMDTLH